MGRQPETQAAATRKSAAPPWLLWLSFGGAGFAGLVLEIVWVRVLGLVLGASTCAVSIVLASYMAGLALGSIVFGNRSTDNARVLYARLLAGIGLTGLMVTLVAPNLGAVFAPLLGSVGWNSPFAIALRCLFGFLVLLVPATLLGGLFPLVSQLAIQDMRLTGSKLAGLYFVNTLGSVLGTLAAGFFLLERLGVTWTAILAAAVCLALWTLTGTGKGTAKPEPGPALTNRRSPVVSPPESYSRASLTTLVVACALSGFAGLGCEVVWVRGLATILGHPLYSVTIVTASVLTGLALGGLVFGRLCDRWRDPLLGFAALEAAIGGVAVLALLFVAASSHSLLDWLSDHTGGRWSGVMLGLAGFSFLAVLAPTFLMGATLPVAGRILVTSQASAGRAVGRLYAANSAGALAGSLVAGFLLVPTLGATRANVVLAAVSVAAAVIALMSSRARRAVKTAGAAAFALCFVLLALFAGTQRVKFLPPDVASAPFLWKVLCYEETSEGVVVTAENGVGDRQTWVNSSVVCGSALPALKPVRLMGVLPFVLHPHAEDILVIGYGLGVTSSILATLSPKPVDCVEICPGVIKASRQFSRWNDSVFANPRLRLMPGDGRNYLLCTRKQYDVISCDPTHPSLGSGALYTQEFYRLCRRRLRPGGVFTLYMPLHQIREPDFRRLLGTFAREFPRCGLWLGIAHAVLVGVDRGPLVLDYQRATGVFAALPSGTGDALRAVFLDDARRLCGSMLLDSAGMYAIGSGAGVAADDRPGFEYAGARAGGTATWTRNAEVVLSALTGPGRALAGAGAAQDSVIAAASATAARLCATVAAMRGDREQQVAWFRQALQFDPEDREAARFLAASLPPDR